MILSPHEVAHLALKAGFRAVPATMPAGVTATEVEAFVAICIAESGLNTDVIARSVDPTSANLGQRDHGIAQLSGRWHWDKIQAVGGRWRDPVVNIGIAYAIFVGRGRLFTDWSVFNSGAFKTYLPDARIAAAHPWPYAP